MPLDIPPEARQAAPGLIGSLIALPFLQGPPLMRVSMFLGGVAASFYGTGPAAKWLGMAQAEGLAGFLLGMFSMAIAAKCYEAINSFAADGIGKAVMDWLRKKLGV